jgi:plastocyanin
MVFAVNCGADGSQNSFTNFKNAALAQGAAAASSTAGYPESSASPAVTGSGGATPSATTGPQVHTVIVGGANGDVYTPSSITAQPNDIVTFQL